MAQKNANCNFVPTLAQDILRSQHVHIGFIVLKRSIQVVTTSHKMRSNHVPTLALATKVNTKLQKIKI